MRVSGHAHATTTCSENSNSRESPLHLAVFRRSRLLLTSMPTVSWMCQQRTRLASPTESQSPTIRVVYQRKRLSAWSRRLRNTRVCIVILYPVPIPIIAVTMDEDPGAQCTTTTTKTTPPTPTVSNYLRGRNGEWRGWGWWGWWRKLRGKRPKRHCWCLLGHRYDFFFLISFFLLTNKLFRYWLGLLVTTMKRTRMDDNKDQKTMRGPDDNNREELVADAHHNPMTSMWMEWVGTTTQGRIGTMVRERSATYEGQGQHYYGRGRQVAHHHNDLLPLATLLPVRWWFFFFVVLYRIIK